MEKRNTKGDFIGAFWELYSAKPIEKISVNELCRLAGYNRATFYNHFKNIYDLLDKAVDDIFIPVKENVLSKYGLLALLRGDMIETLFTTYFPQEDKYIELLFKRDDDHLLNKKMKDELLLQIKEELKDRAVDFDTIEMLLEYQISAVLSVISYWFGHNRPMSESELIRKLYSISTNGVLSVLKDETN